MSVFNLWVNGEFQQIDADGDIPLLWVLRDILGLTGTKFSCGIGSCGVCTIHLDDVAVTSCTLPLVSADGRKITTIEGLAANPGHPVLDAWIAEQVPQCGYCQPGQIMAAAALLMANPSPNDAEIDAAMDAVLCRCGTYQRIRSAIHRASHQKEPEK